MLAIFDTQVLSIFRRQKEIGTYIALGYTRRQVVGLFTVEGTMYAVLAALLSAAYGIPFLAWQAKVGWTMPMDTSDFGMAICPDTLSGLQRRTGYRHRAIGHYSDSDRELLAIKAYRKNESY